MIFLFVGLVILWCVSLWFCWFVSRAYYAHTYEGAVRQYGSAMTEAKDVMACYREHLLSNHGHVPRKEG